jgi:hypothetical protein
LSLLTGAIEADTQKVRGVTDSPNP